MSAAVLAAAVILGGLVALGLRDGVRRLSTVLRDRYGRDLWRCRRCGRSELRVAPHPTRYAFGAGGGTRVVIALCDPCFAELGTAEARYPFYAELLMQTRERLADVDDEAAVARLDAEIPAIVAAIRVGA